MQHVAPPHPELLRILPWIIYGLPTLLALLALIWGLIMVRMYYRDGRWQREGRCLRCGYDLRHSADRCPECGQSVDVGRRNDVAKP